MKIKFPNRVFPSNFQNVSQCRFTEHHVAATLVKFKGLKLVSIYLQYSHCSPGSLTELIIFHFPVIYNVICNEEKLRYNFLFVRPASARSYKIGVVSNWLVGNAFFSETALRILLIFCMKLVDYKGRKVTAGFLKKNLDLEIFVKRSPNQPKIRH